MARCNHSWGSQGCDGKPAGILCYAHRDGHGGSAVCVEVSCDRFTAYHEKHGGIIVLVAWAVDVSDNAKLKAEMVANRSLFEQAFAAQCRPDHNRDQLIKDTMAKYDRLTADLDRWVIEFRNGDLFQNLEAENGGSLVTAQRFDTKEGAEAFMVANSWICANGGMVTPALK